MLYIDSTHAHTHWIATNTIATMRLHPPLSRIMHLLVPTNEFISVRMRLNYTRYFASTLFSVAVDFGFERTTFVRIKAIYSIENEIVIIIFSIKMRATLLKSVVRRSELAGRIESQHSQLDVTGTVHVCNFLRLQLQPNKCAAIHRNRHSRY